MAKFIEVTVNEKPYRLTFNRRSVQRMEDNGFDIQTSVEKPATTFYQLVKGSLYANHPWIKNEEVEVLVDVLDNEYGMTEVLEVLATLYTEVFQSEGEKKKLEIQSL